MKISIIDSGSGIVRDFAKAIGATTSGRFVYIPKSKGAGYLTGFAWEDMRMMIRNYHLTEEVIIERTNNSAGRREDMVFLLSGILPSPAHPVGTLQPEQVNIIICRHAVSTIMEMPANTLFGSITIAVSKAELQRLFGHLVHPVAVSVLQAGDHFVLETAASAQLLNTAADMVQQPVPKSLENQYYELKCKELLCHIFALLMQREAIPAGHMHIRDIKAIYNIKQQLQSQPGTPPHIAALAQSAGMSEPKLRKLFRQTFGKGIFEYYQAIRMQKAAQLLRDKRLSVSEVGYQLGFTNLSHFAKVFEQHWGVKPKKYSIS